MRLDDQGESSNVEDRRGFGGSGRLGRGGLGIGTVIIALAVSYFFGIDPSVILGLAPDGNAPTTQGPAPKPPADDAMARFVSKVLGISYKVNKAQQAASSARRNALSVRLELQADCFVGVWGKRADTAKNIIEPGEIAQALNAASAIGDDRLQQQTQGRIVPESFTHGSSEQRVRWFKRGMDSGDLRQCDSFDAASL